MKCKNRAIGSKGETGSSADGDQPVPSPVLRMNGSTTDPGGSSEHYGLDVSRPMIQPRHHATEGTVVVPEIPWPLGNRTPVPSPPFMETHAPRNPVRRSRYYAIMSTRVRPNRAHSFVTSLLPGSTEEHRCQVQPKDSNGKRLLAAVLPAL